MDADVSHLSGDIGEESRFAKAAVAVAAGVEVVGGGDWVVAPVLMSLMYFSNLVIRASAS